MGARALRSYGRRRLSPGEIILRRHVHSEDIMRIRMRGIDRHHNVVGIDCRYHARSFCGVTPVPIQCGRMSEVVEAKSRSPASLRDPGFKVIMLSYCKDDSAPTRQALSVGTQGGARAPPSAAFTRTLQRAFSTQFLRALLRIMRAKMASPPNPRAHIER